MDLILAGNWHSDVHEEPMSIALEALGCKVHPFKWHGYFNKAGNGLNPGSLLTRVQRRLAIGPIINRLNRDLVVLAEKVQPDALFIYRGDMIRRKTLRQIRTVSPATVLVGYNNDDPFSPQYPDWLWRHFNRAIPEYDLVLAYRQRNLDDFRRAGARRVELLRSWFIPERHYPLAGLDSEKKYDVVFVGHYENDGRQSMLEAIVKEGFSLGLYGPGYDWDPHIRDSQYLNDQVPVKLVWGEEYNKVLNQGKVALCFFSGLNRDTYTRRCFEIPASGTVMLSQYSDDLASLFAADIEAVFFSDSTELIAKLRWLLADEARYMEIARAGCRKVREAGHDVVSRMRDVIAWIGEVMQEKTR